MTLPLYRPTNRPRSPEQLKLGSAGAKAVALLLPERAGITPHAWCSSYATTLRPTSRAPAMPGEAAAPGRGRPVAAPGRLRARRSGNVVTAGATPVDMYGSGLPRSPCLLRLAPVLRFGWSRRESLGLDRGLSCSACGCGGCCIGHRRLQRAEVDSGVSTGATQWPPAGRTAARLPHPTGKMISLECSVSLNRRSGSDGPRPRVSAGVGAPACSRECMGRAHRREWV